MKTRVPTILLAVILALACGGTPLQAEEKKPAVDLLALFKLHYETRLRAFKEQNMAYQNVVLVGDSITEGFDVARFFPGRRVLNRGIGGDVIGNALPADDPRGLLRRLDASIFDCAATDVFLLIGVNDLNSGRDVETIEAGHRELLGRIKKHSPALRVHVQSLLPTRAGFAARNEPVRQVNTRLRKLAQDFGYDYVDLHAMFVDDKGELKAELTGDGLHLNDTAYRIWRSRIIEVMKWTPAP
jgi:lysophospholipase L1-like esterase